MEPKTLLELLGHSVHHPAFKALLPEYNFTGFETPVSDSYGWGQISSKDNGIYLEFEKQRAFLRHFGEPASTFTNGEDEMIFKEMTFESDYTNKKLPFTFSMPYGLLMGDERDSISVKLGKKSYEKSDQGGGKHHYYFIKDDYRVLTAMDEKGKMIWLRFFLLDLQYKKSLALQKALKAQNKNITTANLATLATLKDALPTKQWVERMAEGDTVFTGKNITATVQVLTAFIDFEITAAEAKKANKVYAAVKKTVMAINRLNDKYGSFIETLEREELVEFLERVVRLTGFVIEEGLDITEDWRQW